MSTAANPTCPHSDVYYNLEQDNFYCSACKIGMGLAYHRDHIAAELAKRPSDRSVDFRLADSLFERTWGRPYSRLDLERIISSLLEDERAEAAAKLAEAQQEVRNARQQLAIANMREFGDAAILDNLKEVMAEIGCDVGWFMANSENLRKCYGAVTDSLGIYPEVKYADLRPGLLPESLATIDSQAARILELEARGNGLVWTGERPTKEDLWLRRSPSGTTVYAGAVYRHERGYLEFGGNSTDGYELCVAVDDLQGDWCPLSIPAPPAAVEKVPRRLPTRELLADYSAIVAKHGPNDIEARDFLADWSGDEEFSSLAKMVRTLWHALHPEAAQSGESKPSC